MTAAVGGRRFRRSPYLILQWSGPEPVLVNADTLACCRVHPDLIAALSRMGAWSSFDDLAAAELPLGRDAVEALAGAGLLQVEHEVAAADGPGFDWDPIELAVQRRTAFGGARVERAPSPPPVIRPRFTDRPATALPPPLPSLPMALDVALARRRSERTYAARPLQLQELSTLLHHAARVVQRLDDPALGDRLLRPFPTAGARSELEIYALVDRGVAGTEPGAYHYDPFEHRLRQLRGRDDDHQRILRSVHAMAGGALDRDPAVVLLITAVFGRIMWKYRDLGLSLIYKDVGALLQTLYLVATALELAPCALGSGAEAENSRWLGLDPLQESQVGCFVIGPGVRP